MITCPKCQSTLPDWATTCQFCQTDVGKVARPPAAVKPQRVYGYGPAPWVWVTYYLIAGWWALSGLYDVVVGLTGIMHPPKADSMFAVDTSILGYVMLILGAVTLVIGLGLILRIEIVRGIVNIFCWLRILGGARRGLISFALIIAWPVMGIITLVLAIVDIVSGALMIYLIGETEKNAPNL